MDALTDTRPMEGKMSILEAFLLCMVQQNFTPQAFQFACVHIKYALRGGAMLKCTRSISPARTAKWCRKWLSTTDDACVAWTWLEEEKKWAAFFCKIAPKEETVRWPNKDVWHPIEVYCNADWITITKQQMQSLLRGLFMAVIENFKLLGIPVLEAQFKDKPRCGKLEGELCEACAHGAQVSNPFDRHRNHELPFMARP
jgi:hypothetical protein